MGKPSAVVTASSRRVAEINHVEEWTTAAGRHRYEDGRIGNPSYEEEATLNLPCQVSRRSISVRIALSTPGLSRHHEGPMK